VFSLVNRAELLSFVREDALGISRKEVLRVGRTIATLVIALGAWKRSDPEYSKRNSSDGNGLLFDVDLL